VNYDRSVNITKEEPMTIRYTEEEAQSLLQSQARKCSPCVTIAQGGRLNPDAPIITGIPHVGTSSPGPPTIPVPGKAYDSKWEEAYAFNLDLRKLAGEIPAWAYKPWKFRIAHRCYYEPDFLVVPVTGILEIHEVKGFWRDDARVKWKAVIEQHGRWFRFFVVKKDGSGWDVREEGK
jgi:hypothetical protein